MLLTENKDNVSSLILFHVDRDIQLHENVFRIESDNYFNLINEARELHKEGKLDLSEDEIKLINTDIGQKVKTTAGELLKSSAALLCFKSKANALIES